MDDFLSSFISTSFTTHPFYATLITAITLFFTAVFFRGWPDWFNNNNDTDDDEGYDEDDDNLHSLTGTYNIQLKDGNNTKNIQITITKK